MSDYTRVLSTLEKNRNVRLSGGFNCIPWGLPKLEFFHPGIEQGKYSIVTANSKVGKCFGKGTRVLMYDGSVKNVEDIQNGELVMGPDSTPRKVSGVTSGKELLYTFYPKYGKALTVNESHILYLVRKVPQNLSTYKGKLTSKREARDSIETMTVKEYLKLSENIKKQYRFIQTDIEFKESPVNFDPYLVGLWVGDGDKDRVTITNEDLEVVNYIKKFSKENNLNLLVRNNRYFLSNKDRSGDFNNSFFKDGINKKTLPKKYIVNSSEVRKKLLAGLIDSDGHLVKNATYEITSQYETLAKDIEFLTRSLGFPSYVYKKYNKKYNKYYYTIRFIKLSNLPILIPRKRSNYSNSKKNLQHQPFEMLDYPYEGEYFGFTVDKDSLFVLDDFTVVHNTQIADQLFLYNTYDFIKKNPDSKIKLKIFYFSLEMSKEEKIRQAICRKLFLDSGHKVIVSPQMLMSKYRHYILPEDILERIKQYEEYFEEFSEIVTFIDNIRNPYGIYSFIRDYAELNGEQHRKKVRFETKLPDGSTAYQEKEIDDYYQPYDPNEYVIIIVDHARLIMPEKGKDSRTSIGDLSSNYFLKMRDKWNYSPVLIQQQAAAQESIENAKFGRLRPTLDGLGTNKETQQDANLILGLFSPFRHEIKYYPGTNSSTGYDVRKFGDHIRFLEILGGRDGGAGIITPLMFHGAVNWFTELPSLKNREELEKYEKLAASFQKK